MKIYTSLLLALLVVSCSVIVPIKGSYSVGSFEAYSDNNKEIVWDNIIDFFAKNGLSIKTIDKSSGLIISEEAKFPYTFENSKGELANKNAWIVVQKIKDPFIFGGKEYAHYRQNALAGWNIRIKEKEGKKTMINVNLVNPSYLGGGTTGGRKQKQIPFEKGEFQSTGVFENMIYNDVK